MRCPNCEAEVSEGEKFCPQCGVPMGAMARCPHCGAALLPGERFCGECGREVRPAGSETVLAPPTMAAAMPSAPPVRSPPKKRSPWLWVGIAGGAVVALGCAAACVVFVLIPALLGGTPQPLTPTAIAFAPTFTPVPLALATSVPLPSSTPSPTAGPTATPTLSLVAGMLLYEEDFSFPGEEWDIKDVADAEYRLDGDAYSIEVRSSSWMAWNTTGQEFADFVFDFDAVLVDGDPYNAYGCLVRYQDKDNHYELDINGNGSYSFGKDVDDEWSLIREWTSSAAINPLGDANHVQLVVYGNTFTFYVNDQFVDEFTDDTFLSGEIAVVVTAYDDPPARALFDNIQVHDAELR